jgi:hypothetical protein
MDDDSPENAFHPASARRPRSAIGGTRSTDHESFSRSFRWFEVEIARYNAFNICLKHDLAFVGLILFPRGRVLVGDLAKGWGAVGNL